MFAFTALPRQGWTSLILRRGAGSFALLLGLATMYQYWAQVDFGIDQLIAADDFTAIDLYPGRMSRGAAAGFILFGLATLFTPRPAAWAFWTGFAFTATGFWISLFVCVGFAFEVYSLYGSTWFSGVAMHTGLGFLALFAAAMFAVPDRGWARIVMTDKFGGVVARRLLPSWPCCRW